MKHRGKRPRIYRKKVQTVAQNENALPGYPHYPQRENVMMSARRAELDIEKFPGHVPVQAQSGQTGNTVTTEKAEPRTESDINEDDLAALGSKESDMDEGDDERMSLSGERYDRTAEELDIPGTELDDENEKTGNEDEENNYYNLGGDKDENSS